MSIKVSASKCLFHWPGCWCEDPENAVLDFSTIHPVSPSLRLSEITWTSNWWSYTKAQPIILDLIEFNLYYWMISKTDIIMRFLIVEPISPYKDNPLLPLLFSALCVEWWGFESQIERKLNPGSVPSWLCPIHYDVNSKIRVLNSKVQDFLFKWE